MASPEDLQTIRQHFVHHFKGHELTELQWQDGPMKNVASWFKVLRFAPGTHNSLWVYVSVGASRLSAQARKLEFVILSAYESPRFVELITMTAHYHSRHNLSVGDTVPLGEPWVPESHCHSYLVSRPYPLGPEFEVCNTADGHIHTFWLLPITDAERNFKIKNGVDALEERFEDVGLEYWNPARDSVL